MTAAHYKGGHHPGNDLGLHYTALPPIVASCPYSDQLLVTRKFWSPAANRPSQARAHVPAPRRPQRRRGRGVDVRRLPRVPKSAGVDLLSREHLGLSAERACKRPGLLANRPCEPAELGGIIARGSTLDRSFGDALHDRG